MKCKSCGAVFDLSMYVLPGESTAQPLPRYEGTVNTPPFRFVTDNTTRARCPTCGGLDLEEVKE